MSRRRDFLRTSASIATASLLAGCSVLEGDGPDDDDPAGNATGSSPTDTADGTPSGDADLEARSRSFLETMAAGEFEAAHGEFHESVQGQLSADRLESVWQQLETSLGQYVGVTDVEREESSGQTVLVLTAEFTRGSQRFRFTYQDGALVGFFVPPPETAEYTPPDYVDESAFSEEEMAIEATDACSLGATLTIPEGDGAVPGVVLVHGNGPQDRNESVGPNRPFQDIAWGLATQGIAVLRYDKRTAACDVDPASLTIDEVATDDAVAALDLLRGQERVRDDAVFVAGHSIGGTLAPRIAARDGQVAGAAMLAPLGRPVPDAMVEQTEYIVSMDGEVSAADEEQLDRVRDMAEQIRSLDVGEGEVVHLGGREYWETMTGYERFETARSLDVPLYLVFGGRDWQVTVEDDRPLWRDALGDEPNATFRTYDSLNHFLIPGEGQPTQAEYFEPGHVQGSVVTDLAGWIGDATGDGE